MASGRALDLFRKLDQSNAVIHLDAKNMAARTLCDLRNMGRLIFCSRSSLLEQCFLKILHKFVCVR